MSLLAAFIVPHPPVILPEVGHGRERDIAATIASYREAAGRIASLRPDTIVVTSPHSACYYDYYHISPGSSASGSFSAFGAPDKRVCVDYDTQLVALTQKKAGEEGLPAGTFGEKDKRLDHGTMIPLSFIMEKYTSFRIMRIGLSGLGAASDYALGRVIAAALNELGRRAVFVASGDLSHKLREDGPYGFAKEGPEFDSLITRQMAEGDLKGMLDIDDGFGERAAECGLGSFRIMCGALDGLAVKPELLSYEGPFGVGYGAAAFTVTGSDPQRSYTGYLAEKAEEKIKARTPAPVSADPYVSLALRSLKYYLETGRCLDMPDDLPEEMLSRRAGVFVSLHEDDRLRGCIGTISPARSCVAEEIIRNAVSAGAEDPRFDEVKPAELPYLVCSVDVLGTPEPIADDSLLDVKKYGVIVSSGGRRGLLLPDLDGVDTPSSQIEIARRKAGIGAHEKISLQRFEVVRHI